MNIIKLALVFILLFQATLLSSQMKDFQNVNSKNSGNDLIFNNGFEAIVENTNDQLAIFYAAQGGQSSFPDHYINSIETLLYSQDDIVQGNHSSARKRIDTLLEAQPLSTNIWWSDRLLFGLNVGSPIAYYGIRMLDFIADAGQLPTIGTLNFTAVIANCASVTRPTLPDLTPETVQLDINPEILADNYKVLYQSTDLFRHWVKAITGGYQLQLNIVESPICTTVNFQLNESLITSYPDSHGMINSLSSSLINETDLWWVIAPSGVPGDGSEFNNNHFITGGMGSYSNGAPLILSDDAWFIRKISHLGEGPYSEVERRVYLPQWFQHEFMHHLFRTWPKFGLEDSSHQWFIRSTWPKDFIGSNEADYYSEALTKRLLTADTSLADGLSLPNFIDFSDTPLSIIAGEFERQPVENGFHQVTITINNETSATWSNASNVSWPLIIREGILYSHESSPYGEKALSVLANDNNEVTVVYFLGEAYIKQSR